MLRLQSPLPDRYTLASDDELETMIRAAKTELGDRLLVLGHHYQRDEVIKWADARGDSFKLARFAADNHAATDIVFCGVHFMAETAKILSPDKTVLIPDQRAGCSLADSITADELRAWKEEHPGAVVVSYVNTTAAVKALTDICCTSSNAVDVVESIDPDREVLFCPDQFLGAHVPALLPLSAEARDDVGEIRIVGKVFQLQRIAVEIEKLVGIEHTMDIFPLALADADERRIGSLGRIFHQHGRGAAGGEALDELDGVLAVFAEGETVMIGGAGVALLQEVIAQFVSTAEGAGEGAADADMDLAHGMLPEPGVEGDEFEDVDRLERELGRDPLDALGRDVAEGFLPQVQQRQRGAALGNGVA